MIEITEEMLDAIEAVKGRREANYWVVNLSFYCYGCCKR